MGMPNPKRKPVDDWRERKENLNIFMIIGLAILLLCLASIFVPCLWPITACLGGVGFFLTVGSLLASMINDENGY